MTRGVQAVGCQRSASQRREAEGNACIKWEAKTAQSGRNRALRVSCFLMLCHCLLFDTVSSQAPSPASDRGQGPARLPCPPVNDAIPVEEVQPAGDGQGHVFALVVPVVLGGALPDVAPDRLAEVAAL